MMKVNKEMKEKKEKKEGKKNGLKELLGGMGKERIYIRKHKNTNPMCTTT